MRILFLFIAILTSINFSVLANEKIIIASTTSTSDTGLLAYINNYFSKKHNIEVHVIAVGTGQAIRLAQDGNIDLLLVHHTQSEIEFIKKGYGLKRYNLMYNDYILIGPKNYNKKCKSIESKLMEIYKFGFSFISRGDNSGTNKKELELWEMLNLNFNEFDDWYMKIGQGMGPTLLMANETKSYTLSDRGTWISFSRKENLEIICENMPPLFNQYGLILVNPKINKDMDLKSAKTYINWIISEEGKKLINNYKINGKQLFFFNHH